MDYDSVVFFEPNRVWRVYSGGRLLDEFCGGAVGADSNLPEDWLASTTRAVNRDNQRSPDEGLSVITGNGEESGLTFAEFLQGNTRATLGEAEYDEAEGVGVLCKFLDSAVRLPIQCHPDREFAKQHYHSNHGKAEAWLILDTREINGEKPYLLMGFKPGVTPRAFADAVEEQDIPAIVDMMHRVEVRAGDMYFIPGRFPHAIGPGVFLLEIQEPTDWVVQPERYLGDLRLSDADMWGPVTPEVGLACFDYENAFELEKTLYRVRLAPHLTEQQGDSTLSQVLTAERTGCFEVRRLDLNGRFTLAGGGYVGIITSGRLEMADDKGRTHSAEKGQSFFIPACVGQITYRADLGADVFLANRK
jgi:mannose-6-phosphate isomerase